MNFKKIACAILGAALGTAVAATVPLLGVLGLFLLFLSLRVTTSGKLRGSRRVGATSLGLSLFAVGLAAGIHEGAIPLCLMGVIAILMATGSLWICSAFHDVDDVSTSYWP